MILLSQIITSIETAFRAKYGQRLPPSHEQALTAMKQCRTAHSPMMKVQCGDCSHQALIPHSCGNRQSPLPAPRVRAVVEATAG